MAVLVIHESPGGTQAQYEEIVGRLTDGKGLHSTADWPVEGLLSHVAGPSSDAPSPQRQLDRLIRT